MNHNLRLDIGGIGFEIEAAGFAWSPAVRERYEAFVSEREVDWRVAVVIDPTVEMTEQSWLREDGEHSEFHIYSYRGWVNFIERRALISAPTPERAASAIDRILTYVCVHVLPRQHHAVLIHGAGIVVDGKGFVFAGASGRGKTTVATLARQQGLDVLSDEAVIVRCAPGEDNRILSTPFWGHSTPVHLIGRTRRDLPLGAIYLLEHGAAFEAVHLPTPAAVASLLTTEKAPVNVPASAEAWLNVVERLPAATPVYRLRFLPTTALWDAIGLRGMSISTMDDGR